MQSKYIKIAIAVIILLILIFVFVFINKSTKENSDDIVATSTPNNDRVPFNTVNNNYSYVPEPNTNTTAYEAYEKNSEDTAYKDIKKILSNWEITKDPKMLKEALALSAGADNESRLEPWRLFISKDSKELMKIINSSSNMKETSKDVYTIFEWYIYLSGEYENISPQKKQEILGQYTQLKNYLGIK